MVTENYIEIGRTLKVHGVKGALKVKIKEEYLEDFVQTQVLFLDLGRMHVPYFIKQRTMGNDLIVYFEDVDSREQAFDIASKKIFLREQDLIPEKVRELETDSLEFGQLKGFVLQDVTLGELGEIEEIVEFPQQEMAFVTYQKKEVMIPLNANLIVEIKEKERQVLMDLPEGLLDM